MADLTLRLSKGSPLTNAEFDANFSNLNAEVQSKQAALESGVSIKSLNGASLLGPGNLLLDGGAVISETPPDNPTAGKLWWNSATGTLNIFFNDGTSSQWVGASGLIDLFSSSAGGGSAASAYSNQYAISGVTTGATETEIFVGGVANARIPVALDTTCAYIIEIVAKRTDAPGDTAVFTLRSVARNVGGVVTDVGSVYEVVVARTDINLNVDARANDAADAFGIYVSGVTGKSFAWKAVVSTVEI